jgi:hypothetical protein
MIGFELYCKERMRLMLYGANVQRNLPVAVIATFEN